MYWGEIEGIGTIAPDPDGTRFALCLFEAGMAPQDTAISLTLSPFRRPTLETMPVKRQGRLPVSQQRPRTGRGALSRIRQRHRARHAGQCRGVDHGQCVHGQGRRRSYARVERNLPERHHTPPASSSSCAMQASRCMSARSATVTSSTRTRSSPPATTSRSSGQPHRGP